MTERHPSPDELLDLALANPTGPRRGLLTQHLVACEACRREYAEVAAAVDQVVIAAPQTEPPPGFDRRVVAAMSTGTGTGGARGSDGSGVGAAATTTSPVRITARRRVRVLLAAAAVVGALVGAGAAAGLLGAEPEPQALGVPVVTDAGDRVGTVAASRFEGRDVLVVEIEGGRPGATYSCRLVFEDGTSRTVGEWTIGDYDQAATWVVPAPGPVAVVELVAESGAVWATAEM
ncbi:MAG: hypothetical protein ACYC1Z_13845 [Georgenia sp.]